MVLVLSGSRTAIDDAVVEGKLSISSIFKPREGEFNLSCTSFIPLSALCNPLTSPPDHHKIVVDDESYNYGHGHAYDFLGVDPAQGAVVTVRPDQYVAMVSSLDDVEGVQKLFDGVLLQDASDRT